MNSDVTNSVFSITGTPAPDFIEEITDTRLIKKSELFFALFVEGLPGEPDFGVGIADLVGEQNVVDLRTRIENKLRRMPEFVENITYTGSAIQQDVSNQYFAVDMHFNETASAQELMIPLGFSKTEG